MKSLSLLSLTLLFVTGHGWIASQRRVQVTPSLVRLALSSTPGSGETTEDPCWQDLYDDDCSMSSVYSASFVAGKWIKSMPCASGLDEDCDMGDLDVPENRPEAGVDNVDVMDFLGLKKAESINKSEEEEDDVSP